MKIWRNPWNFSRTPCLVGYCCCKHLCPIKRIFFVVPVSLFALNSSTRKYMNAHTSYECCNKFFRWSKNNFFMCIKCFKWLLLFVVWCWTWKLLSAQHFSSEEFHEVLSTLRQCFVQKYSLFWLLPCCCFSFPRIND